MSYVHSYTQKIVKMASNFIFSCYALGICPRGWQSLTSWSSLDCLKYIVDVLPVDDKLGLVFKNVDWYVNSKVYKTTLIVLLVWVEI